MNNMTYDDLIVKYHLQDDADQTGKDEPTEDVDETEGEEDDTEEMDADEEIG